MGIANAVSVNTTKKTEKDFYQTPEVCVKALCQSFVFRRELNYLDPCAGNGVIGKIFKEYGINIDESDLYYGEDKRDFLLGEFDHYSAVIANPPYSLKNQFIDRALDIADYVYMILPMQVVNYNRFHEKYLARPEYKGRLLMTPKFFMTDDYQVGLDHPGGVSSYAWFCWSNIIQEAEDVSSSWEWYINLRDLL